MPIRTQADLFIETLTEMLEVERSLRIARLQSHCQSDANRFVLWPKGDFEATGHPSAKSRHGLQVAYAPAHQSVNR